MCPTSPVIDRDPTLDKSGDTPGPRIRCPYVAGLRASTTNGLAPVAIRGTPLIPEASAPFAFTSGQRDPVSFLWALVGAFRVVCGVIPRVHARTEELIATGSDEWELTPLADRCRVRQSLAFTSWRQLVASWHLACLVLVRWRAYFE